MSGDGRGILAQRLPFLPQRGDIEWRRVHGRSQARRRAFQPFQQLIDAGDLHVLLEKPLLFQRIGNLRNEMPPDAAHVCECRENPYGRRAERHDAGDLERVAGGAPDEKVFGELFVRRVDTFGAAYLFDQEPERRVDEVSIELTTANADRNSDFSDLADDAGAKAQQGADEPLGQRDEVVPNRITGR